MKSYIIRIDNALYRGLFTDSCAAVIDALDRFPCARRISVRAA